MHTVYILANRVQAVHSTALVLFENCQKLIVRNAQEWILNVLVYLHQKMESMETCPYIYIHAYLQVCDTGETLLPLLSDRFLGALAQTQQASQTGGELPPEFITSPPTQSACIADRQLEYMDCYLFILISCIIPNVAKIQGSQCFSPKIQAFLETVIWEGTVCIAQNNILCCYSVI